MICYAKLSERYINYLNLCVPNCNKKESHFLNVSIQDTHFKGRELEQFQILHIGDGTGNRVAYVKLNDGQDVWIKLTDIKIVSGDIRKVQKRGKIRMGKSSLMGSISCGIKNGKVFRGR